MDVPVELPAVRGTTRRDVEMKTLSWLRAGGKVSVLFYPADEDDLADFLRGLPLSSSVAPIGVASNLLVRDGGYDGVFVRLRGALAAVEVEDDLLIAGAGALDQRVAQTAQQAGLSGLEFMIGIPGSIGGAVRMNAGAFGGETAERLVWIDTVDRRGQRHRLSTADLSFSYRHSALPPEHIVVRAAFKLTQGHRQHLLERMTAIKNERERAQPLRVATGGSTFKNPPGHRAWQLIDAAGCRGLVKGAAMVSDKHCNFLINTGGASAADIEDLGELVRARVLEHASVDLQWEIVRVGEHSRVEAAA